MKKYIIFTTILSTFLSFASDTHAQRGDRGNKNQPEVWRDMDVPPAPRLSPEEQLKTFRIAPEFEIQLVASEPMVETPVVLNWDASGRLWVVEMRAYMPNVDGTGEDARTGRITVLEDTNGDGRMDKVTRFLEELQMPRAIAFVKGGVLVAEPPNILFCEDLDGDLKCDKKTPVANYGKQGPVEHTENGLLPAIDNWMYNAKSSRRFQFRDGKIIEEKTAGRGQWGIAQDNYGRLYANGNSSWLHADTTPPGYRYRNPNHELKSGFQGRIVGSSEIFSIRVNPGINRGYQSNMLLSDGRLARVTAISGPTIYRGDQYPSEYVGSAFVPEPSANAVGLWHITDKDGKLSTTHATYPDPDWEKREFLASEDERFRPVSLFTGPDGCLYVCDMYRGILQHKVYVTTFLRKQIIERELDKHIDVGRIWRVVHKPSAAPKPAPKLANASTAELVQHLEHPNGTIRDIAQRLLVEQKDPKSAAALHKLAQDSDNHLARIHALWTLQGIEKLTPESVLPNLTHEHPKVRQHALRSSESIIGQHSELAKQTLKMATEDEDSSVQFQAALSMAQSADLSILVDMVASKSPSSQTIDAIMTGLHEREARFLTSLLQRSELAKSNGGYSNLLNVLAAAIHKSQDIPANQTLLATIAAQPQEQAWRKSALLSGLLSSKGKAIKFQTKPASLDLIPEANKLAKKYTWKGDTRKIEIGGKPLSPENRKLFEKGKILYTTTCMPCHLATGEGQPAVAPPLADSPFVTGSETRLIHIVLDGLMGPITVNGQEWNLVMPPHKHNPTFTDENVAAILTYIRREWGHEADPVNPVMVELTREKSKDRNLPWTIKDLPK